MKQTKKIFFMVSLLISAYSFGSSFEEEQKISLRYLTNKTFIFSKELNILADKDKIFFRSSTGNIVVSYPRAQVLGLINKTQDYCFFDTGYYSWTLSQRRTLDRKNLCLLKNEFDEEDSSESRTEVYTWRGLASQLKFFIEESEKMFQKLPSK